MGYEFMGNYRHCYHDHLNSGCRGVECVVNRRLRLGMGRLVVGLVKKDHPVKMADEESLYFEDGDYSFDNRELSHKEIMDHLWAEGSEVIE